MLMQTCETLLKGCGWGADGSQGRAESGGRRGGATVGIRRLIVEMKTLNGSPTQISTIEHP